MNKNSIPAFIEDLAVDTANAKYSKAKLKIYYVGQTVDRRLFTKEFSDKLLSTIAYTPVVGYYSVADEDFIGHNNVQHIYGIVPESANIEYQEDTEQGVTFAVTDIILYTGREDEIGTVASKIVGKQHSLELDPKTVAYKINYDEAGNFKNLEFTEGELVGLSVLGDKEKPAFSGSEFFSAEQLPDFITEENQSKYQALFEALTRVEPTAEESRNEIYDVLEQQDVYGYICEHKVDQYVVVEVRYNNYNRYILSREENNVLTATLEGSVRPRFLSDEEINTLDKNNTAKAFEFNVTPNEEGNSGTEPQATPGDNTPASNEGAGNNGEFTNNPLTEELEAVRSNLNDLQNQFDDLTVASDASKQAFEALNKQFKDYILNSYGNTLPSSVIEEYNAHIEDYSIEALIESLQAKFEELQAQVEEPIAIIQIDNNTSTYNECDEVDVVNKFSKKRRGNN